MMDFLVSFFNAFWGFLLESSVYILLGLLVAGLLKVFLNPQTVANRLGTGKFAPVLRASLWGIPIPLCSCGVLPAAVSLKKQGANNGAVTSFMISTPESGVDSIAITYALLDPIMTVIRPVAAFVTAAAAGIAENILGERSAKKQNKPPASPPDLSCAIDGCCDGTDCPPEEHRNHHRLPEKLRTGVKYAMFDVWGDIAAWFFVGLVLAGLISAALPPNFLAAYLGGGVSSMLLMLAMGIPMYICATASTPVAAALILQGVSPGAALVFLLTGPATNLASLSVLLGLLGKRATILYLAAIALFAVLFGLAADVLYGALGVSARAMAGQASEIIPHWLEWVATAFLLVLSAKPLYRSLKVRINQLKPGGKNRGLSTLPMDCSGGSCGCGHEEAAAPVRGRILR